uniref:AlNc14C1956G13115 protein n=1 Tax=Albugo laibachii Nc14 TaxID=890382 RepID=F0X2V7_9STRA|nr:AlNc14C1956G13115 [Albugo laibachii Nc14]|eukprot:CCA28281.1 AlNc14C1956G13115 [Albugo laibachii Nc14]
MNHCTWLHSRSQSTTHTFDLNLAPITPPYQEAIIVYYGASRSQYFGYLRELVHIVVRPNQRDISYDGNFVGLVLIESPDKTVADLNKIIKQQNTHECISLTETTQEVLQRKVIDAPILHKSPVQNWIFDAEKSRCFFLVSHQKLFQIDTSHTERDKPTRYGIKDSNRCVSSVKKVAS